MTRIEISFYKPTGFIDTFYLETDDRGLAAKTILERYNDTELACLNYIHVTQCSKAE